MNEKQWKLCPDIKKTTTTIESIMSNGQFRYNRLTAKENLLSCDKNCLCLVKHERAYLCRKYGVTVYEEELEEELEEGLCEETLKGDE